MTPVSRACAPVAMATSLFALACATQPPPVAVPSALAAAVSGARAEPEPEPEPEQPSASGAAVADPAPQRTELTCDDLAALPDDLDSGRAQSVLSFLVATASTSEDLDCVRRTVARFFPLLARERPPPGDPADLSDWWRTLGDAGHYTDDEPSVFVVMPEPIPRLGQVSQTRLAALLCSENDRACGVEARIFLADVEEQMTELANVARLERIIDDASEHPLPSEEDAIAGCADAAREEGPDYAFTAWRSCVSASVSQTVRVPRGPFKTPDQGILTIHRSGHWDPCFEVAGLSLASGLTLTNVNCRLSDGKPRVSRWRLSRAAPPGVRRVALFIALMDQMRSGPAVARAVPIPVDLPVEDPKYVRFARHRPAPSDASEIEYSVDGLLARPLSGRLYEDHEIDPERRLLIRLLRTSQAIGITSCAEPQDQPVLAELLAQMYPNASDRRSLEEEVTRSVSCVAPATEGS